MKLESIRIDGANGELPLAGLRYVPVGRAKRLVVVLAHGFTSGKYSLDSVAAFLAGRGHECVTFDVVGHKLGCTGGYMEHIGQAAENLRQTMAWIRANGSAESIAIIGHSMGAAAAVQVAAWEAASPNAARPLLGIACVCMGVNPTAGFDTVLGASMLKQRADYVQGTPAKELLSGLNDMLESANELGSLPVLLIAARSDVLLPVANVELLGERIGATADLRVIDAMHLDAPDRSRGLLLNWLEGLGA